MTNKVEVTVVIPVYNQEIFIGKALESAIGQTYKNYMILVIDDGSTDSTPQILKRYQGTIKVIRQKNSGTSAAWNKAISIASTDYLIGLDSDDEFFSETIQEVVNVLERHSDADLVYSDYEFINQESQTTKAVANPDPYDPVGQLIRLHDNLGKPDNFLPFGHVRMYSRRALEMIGGYNEEYLYAEDYDLVLRMAEKRFKFVHVPRVLYRYRWHDANKGVVTRREQKRDVLNSVLDFRNRNV